jgi:hypothetical protein
MTPWCTFQKEICEQSYISVHTRADAVEKISATLTKIVKLLLGREGGGHRYQDYEIERAMITSAVSKKLMPAVKAARIRSVAGPFPS